VILETKASLMIPSIERKQAKMQVFVFFLDKEKNFGNHIAIFCVETDIGGYYV
jgi:hypothetical protein